MPEVPEANFEGTPSVVITPRGQLDLSATRALASALAQNLGICRSVMRLYALSLAIKRPKFELSLSLSLYVIVQWVQLGYI